MNGWFMHNPKNWPPTDKIYPLFLAFHLNETAKNEVLSTEGVNYLRKHEPIGCRDYYTVRTLESVGIKAYFSGCMTLTLGKTYKTEEKSKDVFFVDTNCNTVHGVVNILKFIIVTIVNVITILRICKRNIENFKLYYSNKSKLFLFFKTAFLYFTFRNLVSNEMFLNAKIVSQQCAFYQNSFSCDDELLSYAEQLVKSYSKASLVITSRIHCALPCLGMSVPVLYTYNDNQDFVSSCRMEGLIDMFNVVHCDGKRIYSDICKSKIDYSTIPQNKETWKTYASSLIEKCEYFIKCYQCSD
jgi:hypothetical protein